MFDNIQEEAKPYISFVLALLFVQTFATVGIAIDRDGYINMGLLQHYTLLAAHLATMAGCSFFLLSADITNDSPKPQSVLAIIGMVGFLITLMNLIGSLIGIANHLKIATDMTMAQFGLIISLGIGFSACFKAFQVSSELGVKHRLQQLRLLIGTLQAQRIDTHNARDLVKIVEASTDPTSYRAQIEDAIETLVQIQKMEGVRQ